MPFNDYDGQLCRDILTTYWINSLNGLAIVGKNGEFVKVNPAFCRFLGYTESELLQKKFTEITFQADVAFNLEECRKVIAGDTRGFDMQKRYITKFESVIRVLLRVSGITKNGQFMFFISQIAMIDGAHKVDVFQIEKERKKFEFWHNLKMRWGVVAMIGAGIGAAIKWAVEIVPRLW